MNYATQPFDTSKISSALYRVGDRVRVLPHTDRWRMTLGFTVRTYEDKAPEPQIHHHSGEEAYIHEIHGSRYALFFRHAGLSAWYDHANLLWLRHDHDGYNEWLNELDGEDSRNRNVPYIRSQWAKWVMDSKCHAVPTATCHYLGLHLMHVRDMFGGYGEWWVMKENSEMLIVLVKWIIEQVGEDRAWALIERWCTGVWAPFCYSWPKGKTKRVSYQPFIELIFNTETILVSPKEINFT